MAATKVSKAKRIRELYAQGKQTAEIAKIVGCNKAYVRVAGRQRGRDHYYSPADLRYREANPEYVQRSLERWSANGHKWRKTKDGRLWHENYRRPCANRIAA